ncbi:RNA polymerase sigma factor (sigma-70 family) [Pedobacter sp. UYP30]|uniref:RNA polymerase sigma factor n=1 Tax=Pedobacter sp. UYP30 TaxID=1756400 RepID=UPI003398F994
MDSDKNELVPHLFRTEYSKMVSVLTKSFGIEHIETAEDIVSETFLSALDNWSYNKTPENPTAWLYIVAKNKLRNHLARNNTFSKIVSEQLTNKDSIKEIGIDFSDDIISDSQLQMLFAVCHPSISTEAQICLALRILCGLGLNEIADAFLSNKETIHKRLQRAKAKLQSEKIKIEMPNDLEINERLNTVLQTIYLLYSEGYYSESNNTIVRKNLCVEALNLTYLLLDNPITNNHATNSLMSLMCFHTSRLEARQTANGNIVLYDDQDRTLWDTEFIEKGFYYLQQASKWQITSTYYIEASIAYWHTVDSINPDKWTSILNLYDALLLANNSQIVALNRIWAFSKVYGNLLAITEAEKLDLKTNHFYFTLIGELHINIDNAKAKDNFQKALLLAKTNTDKQTIQKKLDTINFENQ